jgi:hypothetical protein
MGFNSAFKGLKECQFGREEEIREKMLKELIQECQFGREEEIREKMLKELIQIS